MTPTLANMAAAALISLTDTSVAAVQDIKVAIK